MKGTPYGITSGCVHVRSASSARTLRRNATKKERGRVRKSKRYSERASGPLQRSRRRLSYMTRVQNTIASRGHAKCVVLLLHTTRPNTADADSFGLNARARGYERTVIIITHKY